MAKKEKPKDAVKLFQDLMEEHNLAVKAQAVPVDTTSSGQVIVGCQLSVEYKKD